MLTSLQEPRTVAYLPIGDLSCFGKNPYGDSLYRVVFSESRQHLVGGVHKIRDQKALDDKEMLRAGGRDNHIREEVGHRLYPLYPGIKAWVLEKWLSPEAYAGPRYTYEIKYRDQATGLLKHPYPERGEYQESHQWPDGVTPSWFAVMDKIHQIEYGRSYSDSERLTAINQEQERLRRSSANRRGDIIRDAQGAFNNKAINISPGRKVAEDITFRYAMDDLKGMPRPKDLSVPDQGFKFGQIAVQE